MSKRQDQTPLTILNFFKRQKISNSTNTCSDSEAVDNSNVEQIDEQDTVCQTTTKENIGSASSSSRNEEFEIGNFLSKVLADEEKYKTINALWIPPMNYEYPVQKIGQYSRRFHQRYLEKYKWLSYSAKLDGVFCKYCVFFEKKDVGKTGSQSVGQLCSEPYRNWKKCSEKFSNHDNAEYHKSAVLRFTNLELVIKQRMLPVNEMIWTERAKQVQENRKKLTPIIKTIIFCGRYGLSLRGHKDYGDLAVNDCGNVVHGEGKFRALLKFRIDSGDNDLKNHLLTCPKNATYIGAPIQNEIIAMCNEIILKKIVTDVKAAKYFSVLADETTDVAKIEQFSLCVRYVKGGKICESFLQFIPVTSTTGESLASVIQDKLKNLGLDLKYLRGQGYDGAGSMSGKFKGVQALIQQKYQTAIYVHCISHCLNLALINACSIRSIRNCMGAIESTYNFFNTPKRQAVLSHEVFELNSESKRDRMKQLCPTRWIQRQDAVVVMLDMLEPVVNALEVIISTWSDKESSTGAQMLLNTLSTPDFIISLLVTEKVFAFTIPLARFLQSVNVDLFEAMVIAETCVEELKSIRTKVDEEFEKVFLEAKTICLKFFNREIIIPRISARQTQRTNINTNSPEIYFKISVFVPFLDQTITQLSERFLQHKNILGSFQCLIPSSTNKIQNQSTKFKQLCEFYHKDLETNSYPVQEGEFKLWYNMFNKDNNYPQSAIEALELCNKTLFPNIYILLTIFCSIPVSTSSVERTFSTMKLLKTYIRNSMANDRLNGLAMLYIYPDISVDTEEVLDCLAARKRKLDIIL